MESSQSIVTLTTDFGSGDGYAGAMKGVVLNLCPQARLVDISHEIPAQNIVHAAFALFNATPFFPPGTVHLVVVDPGVGTDRRPLAISAGGMYFVGPDNGIFTLVTQASNEAVVLNNPRFHRAPSETSATFHGRDIFAAAAAHLAAGVALHELGEPAGSRVELALPPFTQRDPFSWVGQVLYRDHFGNAITNLGVLRWDGTNLELRPLRSPLKAPQPLSGRLRVQVKGREVPLVRTYSKVEPGEPLALIGSRGLLEIAVREGNAGEQLQLEPGEPIVISMPQPIVR